MTEFVITKRGDIEIGYFPALEQYGVVHGFTLRHHGQSDIVKGTLNMALHVGDDRQKVLANRAKVAKALGYRPEKATTCAQVHGNRVVVVTPALVGRGALDYADTIQDTDGLVTEEANVPLMLFYADCVPVMLVDTKSTAFALVHAGWRGAVSKIGAIALQTMEQNFGTRPGNVMAAIGPSIGPCCYEVDENVLKKAPDFKECFAPTGPGHWHLNLWQVNRLQLERAGVPSDHILDSSYCTKDHVEQYFSYRAEQGKTGRMAAVIYRK